MLCTKADYEMQRVEGKLCILMMYAGQQIYAMSDPMA